MTFVFLDANVVAKPVTRTILMVGAARSGLSVGWSATAEAEAARHMRQRATTPADVRRRYGGELTPTGEMAGRFEATEPKDRQLLADAEAAGARFLITEDVDDYGLADLASGGISAVNPDLFLAERLTREAYGVVILRFVELQVNPPTTPAQFHAAIAKQHPRLFAAHADLYDIAPERGVHSEPAVIFRGTRCLRCERIVADPTAIIDGLGPECR
ncbi:hypothetical protein [Agromyces bauzanensis]|uniref:PIN domain-containing protein n=1 Tax=Agromyces bauzanensis TaxID=1308924 RepID=A0A917URR9_9MICO|nr:hypothetical protein [Agromyces bauzanensis]GGJ79950.1 hypothetical protein GCM10011372_18030 [Agromyces bauzanensis]